MRLIDIVTAPWAIEPAKLLEMRDIYVTHLRGEKIDLAAVEARLGVPLANEPRPYDVQNGVAIISMSGVLAQKMNLFSRISGGSSTQIIARDLRQAIEDPAVTAVVLAIDSPGGAVSGTQELAQAVRAAADAKPVVAWSDGTMASAAYWIGAAADRVYVSGDTVAVGSIGVVATHVDVSGAEAKAGIRTTEITAGKYKRIASEYAALSAEGRQNIQDKVDYLYGVFVADVAQARGVSVDTVLQDMADGRVFIGRQAIDAGLVDGVSTLDDLVAALSGGAYTRRRALAQATAGDAPAAASSETPDTGVMQMDLDTLRKDHPDLCAQLEAAGAERERARIQAVEAQTLPGHEALIAGLKFDGKTSGPEAAAAVLAAEREQRGKALANLGADAPPVLRAAPLDVTKPAAAAEPQHDGYRAPAGFGVDADRLKLHQKALDHQRAHNVSYEQALAAVQ